MLLDELFPLPIRSWIPDTLKNDPDELGQALLDKWESNIQEYKDRIAELSYGNDPDLCPVENLPRLALKFDIDYSQYTDEMELRKDIWKAIEIIRSYGLWSSHIKIIIDSITGTDSQLYGRRGTPREDSILVSYNDTDPNRALYWLLAGNGAVTGGGTSVYGIMLSGSGSEPFIAGNVYIDLISSSLTADIIDRIVNKINMTKGGFAFYRIFLGYVTGTVFNQYPGGIIE